MRCGHAIKKWTKETLLIECENDGKFVSHVVFPLILPFEEWKI